jgi:hypothetical protein
MNRWMMRIHMYTGLFNFTALVLFGVVGVIASLLPPHAERPRPERAVEELEFEVPGGLDDRQLADHVQATLALPLTGPAPQWTFRRDDDHNLHFRLPTPARSYEVTVLEEEGRVRLETLQFAPWQYLVHLHEMTPSRVASPDLRARAWTWYLELSIWSLLLMAVSGVYLWLDSRPRHRWAWLSLAVGTLVFAGFYWVVR